MPHEKIISGDLDGDGVEGQRKKISRGEFPRRERNEPGSGLNSAPEEKKERSERSEEKDSGDLFYTGFGNSKPKGTEIPKKTTRIGDDSDIFSTGFGSATQKKKEKLVHVSGSRERREEEEPAHTPVKKAEKHARFSSKETDELFEKEEAGVSVPVSSKPAEATHEKKSRSLSEDPFYTGFGYTDQRGKESPADGGLFPDAGRLPEMPKKDLLPEKEESEVHEIGNRNLSWLKKSRSSNPHPGRKPKDRY